VKKLAPSLPHLKSLLVAFFKGALSAWKRFSMEFDEDGQIHSATTSEKKRAHRPPTNDDNEGALGSFRLHLRKKPNTTIYQYNALAMFMFNDTSKFVKQHFSSEDHHFVQKMAHIIDTSHPEVSQTAELIAHKDHLVEQRREKKQKKIQKAAEEAENLAGTIRVDSIEEVANLKTNSELQTQLAIYRLLVPGIPLKSKLKTKAMMAEALKEAIIKFKELNVSVDEEENEENDM